jgi:nitroreductase
MRRRVFLNGAAMVIVSAASGGIDAAAAQGIADVEDGPQCEPWKNWRGDPHEGPLALVRAAVLASNAFNAQPWLFKVTRSRIELYADVKRNLGMFDPYLREMHLSLGCALENLMLAAAANGYRASLALLPHKLLPAPPNPRPELVARIELSAGEPAVSELYEAIPRRHTNREPYDTGRALPSGFPDALVRLAAEEKQVRVFVFTGDSEREKIADIIDAAGKLNMADPDVRRGIQPWLRTSEQQTLALRDGEPAYRDPSMPPPLQPYKKLLLTARLFGVVAVRDRYDCEQALRAGRIWQRAHLLATAQSLAARVENSAVERIDHERRQNGEPRCAAQIAELTGDLRWQPTLMFYMGYPTIAAPIAARRPVADVEL